MFNAEGLAEGSLAEVEVDQSNLCSLEGHAGCYVHYGEGLTGSRVERSEHHHCRISLLADHQVKVGSENAVCLVHHITAAMLNDDLGHRHIVFILERIELLEAVFLSDVARDLCEERHREVSEVALCLDCVVEHPLEEVYCERNTHTEHERSEEDHHLVRCDRVARTVRVHDDACVTDVDQSCELVLLTLLEEEDVKVLSNLLLTLD